MFPRKRWIIAAALACAPLGGLVGLAWLADPDGRRRVEELLAQIDDDDRLGID